MGVGVVINFPSLPCPGDVAIKATGVRSLFPPARGPDSNPIEQAFSKVEHLDVRRSKTIGDTRRRAGLSPGPSWKRNAPNHFGNAGYVSAKTRRTLAR